MFAEPEHGHSHHHATGVRWVDMIVALSAIFISLVSLVISIEHGRTMQQMECWKADFTSSGPNQPVRVDKCNPPPKETLW